MQKFKKILVSGTFLTHSPNFRNFCFNIQIKYIPISNSNWTEWSTIQGVIGQVISNQPSAKREADLKLRAQSLPELYDTKSNY